MEDGAELGKYIQGYLEKGIQPPMVQGRSTKTISMIEWIRTSRLSITNSNELSQRLMRMVVTCSPISSASAARSSAIGWNSVRVKLTLYSSAYVKLTWRVMLRRDVTKNVRGTLRTTCFGV